MGCHTWFSRPVTKEELEVFKNNAIADAKYLLFNDYIDEYYRVKSSSIFLIHNDCESFLMDNFLLETHHDIFLFLEILDLLAR